MDKKKQARALQDLPHVEANAGDIVAGTASEIDSLVKAGQADDHPSAVEYALSVNARTVDLAAQRAAQLAAAKADAKATADAAATTA